MSSGTLDGGAVCKMNALETDELPAGEITRVQIELIGDGLAQEVLVPVLVAKGKRPGPTFGLTAAVHGNELNGIRVIHDLMTHIDVRALHGTVVAVVVVNVPGLHLHQRHFPGGEDLNDQFPGREDGNHAEAYAWRVVNRIVNRFDYLVDLHTASFGRINSLYVRADMTESVVARMAYLQRPEIIVHNEPSDGTLRGAAMALGIPSITVEIGDPQRFQPKYIRSCRVGLRSVLAEAGMLPKRQVAEAEEPILCERSFWIYADRGGLLEVLPKATQLVAEGEEVAVLRNAFGDVISSYAAPMDGVVVGKSVNPVGQTGARILHLGVLAPKGHRFHERARTKGLLNHQRS